jgi:hypothetical protein
MKSIKQIDSKSILILIEFLFLLLKFNMRGCVDVLGDEDYGFLDGLFLLILI